MKKKCMILIVAGVLIGVILGGCQKPQSCLTGDAFKNQGKLCEAVDSYEQCLGSVSGGARKQLMEDIATLKVQIVEAAFVDVQGRLKSAKTVEQYSQMITLLQSKLKYDSANRIASLFKEYTQKKNDLMAVAEKALASAEKYAEYRKWKEAFLEIDKASAVYPSNARIQKIWSQIVNIRDQYYQKSIQDACKEENWEKAESVLNDYRNEKPIPQESILKTLGTLVSDTKELTVRKQAQRLIESKKYFSARRLILTAKVTRCGDLLERIRKDGSLYYLSLAREEKNRVRDFHAYIAVAKAKILNPDSSEIFTLYRDYADHVEDSIQIKIGIPSFDSPQNEPGAGREFSDTLISHLSKLLPYGVKIDEREKVDFAFEKQGVKEIVSLLGLNIVIFGNVSTLSVETQPSEQQVVEWVKIPQVVPNPQYEQELLALKNQYGTDRYRWPYQPKETIEKETNEKVEYKKGEAQMQGVLTVSTRIFSAADDAVVVSETFTTTREVHDTFQEGVPRAGIKDDPLVLPTNLKLKQELRQDMVEKVTVWVLKRFEQRHKQYYDQAQYLIHRREFDAAIQALAQGYLYSICAKIPENDEWARKTQDLVFYELTETASSN